MTDTVLHGKSGSAFMIRKGTFPPGKKVSIHIREIITPAEILLSGISTLSNGRPLKSGGMFYFEASSGGNSIQPLQSIAVTIPTAVIDRDMQIFKGEVLEDSSINWIDPAPIDTLPITNLVNAGASLYRHCQSCHPVFSDATGPALYNFQNRGPWRSPAATLAFLNSPLRFMAQNDYALRLKEKYGSVMMSFPDLNMGDVQALTAYISSLTSEPVSVDRTASSDSAYLYSNRDTLSPCTEDTSYFPPADSLLFTPDTTDQPSMEPDPLFRFSQPYESGIYRFEISSNGWYNIDAYVPDSNSVSGSDLKVSIPDKQDLDLTVILYIPSMRTQQPLDLTRDQDAYSIPYEDRKLPNGERAIIFAVGSRREELYYGIHEFRIGKAHAISMTLRPTMAQDLNEIMKTFRIDSVDIRSTDPTRIISRVGCDTARPR